MAGSNYRALSEIEIKEMIVQYVSQYYKDTGLAVKLGILGQQFGSACRKSSFNLRAFVTSDPRFFTMTAPSGATTVILMTDVERTAAGLSD